MLILDPDPHWNQKRIPKTYSNVIKLILIIFVGTIVAASLLNFKFALLADGSGTIPFIQVNDDYCDCDVSTTSILIYLFILTVFMWIPYTSVSFSVHVTVFWIRIQSFWWVRTQIHLVHKLIKTVQDRILKMSFGKKKKKPHRSCSLWNPLCFISENKF